MMLYNNPNLKVDELSQSIYNDLNSLMINNMKLNEIRKNGKRLQSCSNFKRKINPNNRK